MSATVRTSLTIMRDYVLSRIEKAFSQELTEQIHNLQSKISDDKSLSDSSPLNPGGVEEVAYYLQQIQMLEAGKALVTSQMFELEKSLSDTKRTLESARRENSLLLERSAQISKRNADLSAEFDEESIVKQALNDNIRVLQEKIIDLTSELNSRPSEDDVAVLRKALIDAQTLMNEITCEKESEIDKLRIKLMSLDEKFTNAGTSIEELQRELDKRPKVEDLQKMKNNLAEAQKYEVDVNKLREDIEKKKIENVNLKKDLEDLEQKSTKQKAAMATLTADVSRLQSMLLDAKESSSKFDKQNEEIQSYLDASRKEKCDLDSSYRDSVEKLQSKEKEVVTMKAELSNKERILRANEMELSKLSRENDELKITVKTMTEKIIQISKEKKEIITKLQSDESVSPISDQMTQDKEAVQLKVNLMDEEYSKKRNEFLHEIDEYKFETAEKDEMIEKLTSENQKLLSEYEKVEEKLREGENQCKKISTMFEKKESEYKSSVNEILKSKQSSDEQVRKMTGENAVWKTELQEIIESRSRLEASSENDRIKLMGEITKLNKTQQKHLESLSDLQAKLNECQNVNSRQVVDSGLAIKSLQQTVDELKTECLRLQEQLNITMETNKQEFSDLNILVTGLEQTVTDLNRQRDELEKRERDCRIELEKSCQKLQQFENVQCELNDKIAVLTFDLTSKQTLVNEMKEKITKLEAEKRSLLSQQDVLTKETCDLTKECATRKSDYENIVGQLSLEKESRKDTEDNYLEEIRSLQSEIAELKVTIGELRTRLKEHEIELDQAMTRNKTLQTEIDEKHIRFANLDAEKIQLESIIHDLTENSDEKDHKIQQSEDKLIELRRRCELLDEKSNRLELELLAMQSKLKVHQENSQQFCNSLEEKLDETKIKLEKLKEEKALLTSEYDAKVSKLDDSLSVAQSSTEESQSELTKTKIQIDNLKRELRQESLMRKVLEAQLSAWSDEKRMLIEKCVNLDKYVDEEKDNQRELKRRLDGAVSAMHDLGREHQSLQIDINKHFGRKWADDRDVTECLSCSKLFSVIARKHHCRNCGMIFCNDCSAKTFLVASSKKPVRVCDNCYLELNVH